jgi:hypothetical protein
MEAEIPPVNSAELPGITSQKTMLFGLSLRHKKHAYSETLPFVRDCICFRRRVLKSDEAYLPMEVRWPVVG